MDIWFLIQFSSSHAANDIFKFVSTVLRKTLVTMLGYLGILLVAIITTANGKLMFYIPYYTAVQRYVFYLRVAKTVFYE